MIFWLLDWIYEVQLLFFLTSKCFSKSAHLTFFINKRSPEYYKVKESSDAHPSCHQSCFRGGGLLYLDAVLFMLYYVCFERRQLLETKANKVMWRKRNGPRQKETGPVPKWICPYLTGLCRSDKTCKPFASWPVSNNLGRALNKHIFRSKRGYISILKRFLFLCFFFCSAFIE